MGRMVSGNCVQWRKSSYSGESWNCVEVASLGDGVAVRDSKDPTGAVLLFGTEQWRTFIGDVRAGEFDGPALAA